VYLHSRENKGETSCADVKVNNYALMMTVTEL
jgi:hypothetical protein